MYFTIASLPSNLITLLFSKLVLLVLRTRKQRKSLIKIVTKNQISTASRALCYFNVFKRIFPKQRKPQNFQTIFSAFVFISYVQGVSEAIKRVLTQIGIVIAMKPHFTLSFVFRKPADVYT